MANGSGQRKRTRGSIERLRSGSLRVRVYAGQDALTGEPFYLKEVVPAGPKAAAEAEKVRTKLLSQVDEQRNPKTRATLNQLLDAFLEVVDVEPTTKKRYDLDVRRLRVILGGQQLAQIQPDVIERYYAQLRQCRDRCKGRTKHVKHRTVKAHDCDVGCVVVPCKPLAVSSIRSVHWVLNSAFNQAVRWRWIAQNPMDAVEPPGPKAPDPRPPTPEEAARILVEASKDPDWGAFIWTALMTGARRGELCALKREDLDLERKVLRVSHGLKLIDKQWVRLGTKTHQHRRIALDDETVAILRAHLDRADERAAQLELDVAADAYLFSLAPDGSEPMIPDTVTQRYDRMVGRLGIETTLHKLRHYSATELISAGVDIRTVAGRLGHGGGGTTTLKVYAAWVSEADQRAAVALGRRVTRLTLDGCAPLDSTE
jgi:integrase